MPTKIYLDESRLSNYYERVMDEIHMLFHHHPLRGVPPGRISESDLVEMNYYQAMGRSFYQSLDSVESQLKAQANAARASGDIGALQSIGRQAKSFNPQINPKFAHLPRTGRTR